MRERRGLDWKIASNKNLGFLGFLNLGFFIF